MPPFTMLWILILILIVELDRGSPVSPALHSVGLPTKNATDSILPSVKYPILFAFLGLKAEVAQGQVVTLTPTCI